MAATTVGAGNRLAPAAQAALDRAADRLAPLLATTNRRTYLAQLQAAARAAGAPVPRSLTDPGVLAAIQQRAQVSATSIVHTQALRMAALVTLFGSRAAAQRAFDQWERGQRDRLASYESAMTRASAQREFTTRNGLTGHEHVEPQDGQCAFCKDLVARGTVPLGTLPSLPVHLNCVHALVQTYDHPAAPHTFWVGGTSA